MKNNSRKSKNRTRKKRSRSLELDSSFVVEPTENVELTENIEEETAIPQSWFKRIIDSRFATKVSDLSTKAGSKWKKFEETIPGKVFKVTTGVAVSRVISIVLASLTIAGLLSPVSPAIAISLGVLGLATVAIGVAMDTARTRNTRQLQKENDLLVKNRSAKSIQDYILKLEPELGGILKDELYQATATGKKSAKERYTSKSLEKVNIAKDVGKAFLKNALTIATVALHVFATKGVNLIKEFALFALAVATESRHNMTIRAFQIQLETQIDNERDKRDTPGYDNLADLRQSTRLQRIQTMALQKLITDKEYWTMSPQEKVAKFKNLKEAIAKTEEAVAVPKNIFEKSIKIFKSLIKDVGRAHDPFSEYNAPGKIKTEKHSELTKAMDKTSKHKHLIPSVVSIKKGLNRNKPKTHAKHHVRKSVVSSKARGL
ncbi:MAG: hypothetical protein J0L79_01455 [Rickettsiales bacterium]|nr:hypothetical protein [Rickettsiales bacterium]MCA0254898.1 hypothetical protein [Pseudomonadota bacterium]